MAEGNGSTLEMEELDASKAFPTFIVATVVLVVLTFILNRVFGAKKLNMPPGPKGLPIVGTLFRTRGPKTHVILSEMSKEWGPIFSLKTGWKYFIVVTSPELTHEALIKDVQTFSSRPKLLSRLNFTGWRSVNSALYGPYWRGIRKNLVTHALSTSKVASFLPFREEELETLITRVKDEAARNDDVVTVLSHCRHTVFSILLHVCFGERFADSTVEELDRILKALLVILAPQVIDFLPFLQPFSKHKPMCQGLLGRMRNLFAPLIEEHKQLRAKGQPKGDYVDSLIVLQKEMNLADNDVLGLIGEVLTGGTDTTANTLEWTMANLIKYPQIQDKLFQEIKRVCGTSPVSEHDVDKMPYLQAVIKEALRKHPALPFGITHGLSMQGKLGGYDIPEEAFVLFHIQAMQNNPAIWDHPEVFDPERFLNNNVNYDMTASHGVESLKFMPFGAGRRICPGMSLGLKHAHLILSRLIQNFEFTTPNPGEEVDFSEKLEFTVVMATPLKARITPRR
ncbi:protein MpCYP770 [Marchantia polymorpha subsp. ruderalis]